MPKGKSRIRFGYWMPVFGGWLRNVEDEQMQANWSYVKRLAQRSEEIGFDLTLVAELNLNDIKDEVFLADVKQRVTAVRS